MNVAFSVIEAYDNNIELKNNNNCVRNRSDMNFSNSSGSECSKWLWGTRITPYPM